MLFWVANSLLIPDIILLLLLFIRSLLLIGGVYNQYMTKRKNDKQMNRLIKELTPDTIGELKGALPGRDNSLYIRYLRDLLTTPPSPDYSDYLIRILRTMQRRMLFFRSYWLRWDRYWD